ncbi:Variant surface glycoprotein [Trypanosoma congolense IL3000]|uniref:Variant surface glycoprotein n=1 Tax=Trypanosoma congolense (strain IL3000) TaxID=1068625 RepID=F9WHG0_TRYCI|nr:Variant surface glycoprotein [Trypanosoma congolense IL3000]
MVRCAGLGLAAYSACIAVTLGALGTAGTRPHNEEEFKVLCRVLRVAEGTPAPVPDNSSIELKAVQQARLLARYTDVNEEQYDLVVRQSKQDFSKEKLSAEDEDFLKYTVGRRIAHEKIVIIVRKMERIYKRIREKMEKATKARENAVKLLAHSIYGNTVDYLPTEENITKLLSHIDKGSVFNDPNGVVAFDGNYYAGSSCGAIVHEAGRTLINDFYCLCVGIVKNNSPCHTDIKGTLDNCNMCCSDASKREEVGNAKCTSGNWTWLNADGDAKKDFSEGWPVLRSKCPQETENASLTADAIRVALEGFRHMLGKQYNDGDSKFPTTMTVKNFVLGKMAKISYIMYPQDEGGCVGEENQTCVNYWNALIKGNGIEWENKLLKAMNEVETFTVEVEQAENLSMVLFSLKKEAERIYGKEIVGNVSWEFDGITQALRARDLIAYTTIACFLLL